MNLVLLACFLPLVIVFLIMKLAVWLSGIYTEEKYVESESRREHAHIWKTHMKILTERQKSVKISAIIDEALYQYYTIERGLEVPNWRQIKDQDWWLDYLDTMGIDRRNP